MTEKELIRAAGRGDEGAFEELVRAYEKRQHALCPAPESGGSEFRSGMCTKETGTEMREKNDE